MRIVEDDWRELEAEKHSTGLVTRRLYPASGQDIHLAVDQVTGQRMLLIRVPQAAAERTVKRRGSFPRTRGLLMQFAAGGTGYRSLQVILTADSGREVFNPLIADIASAAAAVKDPDELIRAAIDRFEHWRRLLESVHDNGLSPERRRGLYGELYVLREIVIRSLPVAEAVNSWVGPLGKDQDFQHEDAALEVKTGLARSPKTLTIASERQLDGENLRDLVLTHIWVDERRGGAGESLNRIVESIRSTIGGSAVRHQFDDLLVNAGYLNDQRSMYDEPRYTARGRTSWRVIGGFPRIVRSDLLEGVGNCRYEISPVRLDPYRISDDEVISIVKGTT